MCNRGASGKSNYRPYIRGERHGHETINNFIEETETGHVTVTDRLLF